MGRKCKVVMCNIRSIVANMGELVHYIEKQKPLAIGLTETRTTKEIEDFEINLNGY